MLLKRVDSDGNEVEIFYDVFTDQSCSRDPGLQGHRIGADAPNGLSNNGGDGSSPPADAYVVLVMGLAAGRAAWTPQLHGLLHPSVPIECQKIRVMTLDNRGIGQSSSPKTLKAYTTKLMASDVTAVMDKLKWERVHLVGHSMGGMIAARLAVDEPDRVASLTLVSSTNGRWQALPQRWRSYKLVLKVMLNPAKRPEHDLEFHFSKDTLRAWSQDTKETRRTALLREYSGKPAAPWEADAAAAPPSQPQPGRGLAGQFLAVLRHSLSASELAKLKAATFRKQVIHGRSDILAMSKWSEWIASRLSCPCILLKGAHMLTRECGTEVNALIRYIIFPPQDLSGDHYMARNAEAQAVSQHCVTADVEESSQSSDQSKETTGLTNLHRHHRHLRQIATQPIAITDEAARD